MFFPKLLVLNRLGCYYVERSPAIFRSKISYCTMSDFDTPPLNQCRVAWGLGKGEGDCIWTLGSQGIIRPNQMRRRRRRRKPQKPLCSTSMIFVSWSCFGKTGMTNIAFDDFFHRLVLNPFHQCLLVVNQNCHC